MPGFHGSATTTESTRRAIQHSQASLRRLAKRYGIKPKTVAKWKSRSSTADQRTGPREPRSTTLSTGEEALVVALRRHTLLPSTTVFTCCSRRSRIWRGQPSIAAYNGMASHAWHMRMATSPSGLGASDIR